MSAPAREGRRVGLAVHSLSLAALLAFALVRLLPVHVLPVDLAIGAVALARLFAGAGLLRGGVRAIRWARFVALVTLVFGMVVTTALLVSVAAVAGIYESVGHGAAIAFGVVAALVAPYLVVFPALELRALAPARTKDA